MFVKLKRFLDGPKVSGKSGDRGDLGLVAPSEHVIFETPWLRIVKLACPIDGMKGPCYIVFDDPMQVEGECFELTIKEHGTYMWMYATNCSMFVMNDNGKTIDSASCA